MLGSPWNRLVEFSYPYVSETHGFALVAMRLKLDRSAGIALVVGLTVVQSLADELEVILHENAVEKYGDISGCFQGTIRVESGRRPDNVVGLPLARLAPRIRQWN